MKFAALLSCILIASGAVNAAVWTNKHADGQHYVEISTSAPLPTRTVTHTVTEVPAAATHTVVPTVSSYELGVGEQPREINTNTTSLLRRLVIDVFADRFSVKSGAQNVHAASVAGAVGLVGAAAALM